MATIGDIGLAEPSTLTKRLAAVEIERNSTVQSQEILVLGSPNSTGVLALAEVMGSAPASTVMGLAVRQVGPVTFGQSTAADALVTVYQSSAAALQMTATLASSANSVLARVTTSSGGGIEGSTILPQTAGLLGLHVRPVFGAPLTVAQSTVGQTTATVLISSATTRPYVSAYVVTSTEAGPITGGFYAGSTLVWPVTIWADGGVPTQMQAVAQPAYVFRGQADRPLEYRLTGSTGTLSVALTYWNE